MTDPRTASAGAFKAHATRKRQALAVVNQQIADVDFVAEKLREEAETLCKQIGELETKAVRATIHRKRELVAA